MLTGGGPGNSTTLLSIDLVKIALGQFDLGPAAAMSLIYFAITLLVSWLFYTLTFVAILTVIPPYLPQATRATLTFWMPLAGLITSLTLGAQLLRILPAVTIILIGLACASLAALAMWAAPSAFLPPIALFAALGLVQGASFTAIPQLNPDPNDQALANGALAQMGNLGNLLGTPILLAMATPMGHSGVILFALLAYAGCAAVHLHAAARRR